MGEDVIITYKAWAFSSGFGLRGKPPGSVSVLKKRVNPAAKKKDTGLILRCWNSTLLERKVMSVKNHIDLNRAIIRGESNGKVLWQPRIMCWYDDREFSHTPLPAPYTGMSIRELYEALGCSNRIYDYNAAVKRIEDPSVKRYSQPVDELRTRHVIETPVGSIDCVVRRNTSNYGEYFEKWWIETKEDMEVQMYVEANQDWEFSQEEYDRVYSIWGENGLGSIYFPRINVQSLFHETMGIEGGIFALMDMPDVCEEYFKVKQANHDRYIKMIEKSGLEWINYGDNIHCAILPPKLFEKYVLPEYQRRNELLHKQGIYTFAHWDGDTKALLKYAKETGLDGIEAITPKPQGDVTLEEIKAALGDQVGLVDGIAAILFDEIYPLKELEEQTKQLIDLFAGKLILGISDEMSSTGNIDRIKYVGEIVDKHNAGC